MYLSITFNTMAIVEITYKLTESRIFFVSITATINLESTLHYNWNTIDSCFTMSCA